MPVTSKAYPSGAYSIRRPSEGTKFPFFPSLSYTLIVWFLPRYTVFFKARDTDAIQAVLDQYTKKIVKKTKERERPSTLEKLKKLKAEIAKKPKKEVEKKKENVR